MNTPIEFGKEFLIENYTKQDMQKAAGFLAEDVIFVSPTEMLHLRDRGEQREYLDRASAERGEPYYVDVSEVVSDPSGEHVRTVSYNIALIPKDPKKTVRIRASLVIRDAAKESGEDPYEITCLHVSRLFVRSATDNFSEFLEDLPGAVMLVAGLGQQGIRVLFRNGYFADHLGYKAEDFQAESKKDPFFFLETEDREKLLPALAYPEKQTDRTFVPALRPVRVRDCVGVARRYGLVMRCAYEEGDCPVSALQFFDMEEKERATDNVRKDMLDAYAALEEKYALHSGLAEQLPMNIYRIAPEGEKLPKAAPGLPAELVSMGKDMPALFEQEEEACRIGFAADPFYGFSLSSVTKESLLRDALDGGSEKTLRLAGRDGSEKTVALLLRSAPEKPDGGRGGRYLYLLYLDRTEDAELYRGREEDAEQRLRAAAEREEKLRLEKDELVLRYEADLDRLRRDMTEALDLQKEKLGEQIDTLEKAGAEKTEALKSAYEAKLKDVQDRLKETEEKLNESKGTIAAVMVRLEREKERALEAEKDKTAFLAGVRGELRMPAEATLSLVEKLQQNQTDDKEADALAKIRIAAQTTLDMADRLFEMENVTSGREKAQEKPFVLRDLVDDLREDIGRRAAAKKQILTCTVQQSVPAVFVSDPAKLRRILWNILDNAVNYTGKGGRIRLSVSMSAPAGGVCPLRFVVEDTGTGIDDELMPKLFQPFVRGSGGAVLAHQGFGLGLAVADGLVRILGGSIGVSSNPGAGSVFTVKIGMKTAGNFAQTAVRGAGNTPGAGAGAAALQNAALSGDGAVSSHAGAACPADDSAAGDGISGPGIAEEVSGRGAELRFLTAEDDPLALAGLEKILRDLGAQVVKATSGPETAALFEKSSPGEYSVVIMDYSLPGEDGLETARRIRETEKMRKTAHPVPIILLTGNAFEADMAASFGATVTAGLPKPVTAKALAGLLGLGEKR